MQQNPLKDPLLRDSPLTAPLSHMALLWRYLSPQALSLTLATLFAALLALVASLVTTLVGPAMQILTTPREESVALTTLLGPRLGTLLQNIVGFSTVTAGTLLTTLPPLLLGLASIRALLTLAQWYLWERAGERVSLGLRTDLTRVYLHMDPTQRQSEAGRTREGALSSTITTDIKLMREYVSHFYGGLPREALQVLFLGVTLALLSPKLTLIFALGLAPAGVALARIGKKLRKRAARALSDYSDLSEWLQQRLLGIETIKHYRTEDLEAAQMRDLTSRLLSRFMKAARVKARTSPTIEGVATLAMAVVLVVAMRDVAQGSASGAVQMSFFSTLALLSQAAGKLGRYLNSNREGAAAVERILDQFQGMAAHQVQDIRIPLQKSIVGQHRIVCHQVSAHYPESPHPALSHFDVTFEGGHIYCLTGASGAGKSTLVRVLLGLLKPSAGQVRFETYGPTDPGGPSIGFVPQKILLMPDSLAANVSYPDPTWDESRVKAALEAVGLLDLALSWPEGLATSMGEGGQGVSGGQAQRILLARLLYHQPPFILVDEGTSALDPEVERRVQAILRDFAQKGHVVITIAHRPSAVEGADRILRLEEGRLVEVQKY